MAFPQVAPGPGYGQFPMSPLYYPPVASKWIFTGLILLAGATAPQWSPTVRTAVIHPVSFFLIALAAIGIFQLGFPPAAFAVFFLLLCVWVSSVTHNPEGFLNASNIDYVTNSKRWYVEKVLGERPLGIQEKDVNTSAISDASAQGATSAGTT